jgi:GntR family transcriptional regulator
MYRNNAELPPEQRELIRQPSLVDQVFDILVERISNKAHSPGDRLPPESQLAREFSVSRATIRGAFARLAERGLIIRRPGAGTFVAKLPSIANPLHQFINIEERIAEYGFSPGFRQLEAEIVPTEPKVAELLEIDPGSPILHLQKIFTADDKPIILFINYIPAWVFQMHMSIEEAIQPGLTEPFFEFFSHKCQRPIKYLISSIRPEMAGNSELPEGFSLPDPCTPLLIVEDVGYDEEETPVFYSIEHLAGIASRFDLVRQVESG